MTTTLTRDTPTHIVDDVSDVRSRCGVKKPRPVIWAPFVKQHVDGYGLVLCAACVAAGART